MRSTSQLRRDWAPACRFKSGLFLAAYAALDACLKAHRYGPRAGDTGAYNCRRITGGVGFSLHAFGPGDRFRFWNGVTIATALAVDINWQTNPYGRRLVTDMPPAMIDRIERIRTRSGDRVWRWGGRYTTNKDAMHFEIVCTPAALATGIDPATLPGHQASRQTWRPFRAGATDASLAAAGGFPNQVTEVQLILTHLAGAWDAPDLRPGPVDGIYGPRSQAAISAFKTRIIGLQRALGDDPWPSADSHVGPKTIGMLRWWNHP